MRRTRHVMLPVKSWQYIGLLVVSLACLTLGLVSRDREGKSGSLAGPELKHNAPHEVDACPNKFPFIIKPAADSLMTEKFTEIDFYPQNDELNKNNNEILTSSTREIIVNDQKMINYRTRNSKNIRTTLENRRLTRSNDRSARSSPIRSLSGNRRTLSIDRRSSDIIQSRESSSTRRENQASSILERRIRDIRSSERQVQINRLANTRRLNIRSIDHESTRLTDNRRVRSAKESHDQRSTELQIRENRLVNTRRLNTRSLNRHTTKLTADRQVRSIQELHNRRSTERREIRINISERQERSQSQSPRQPSSESQLFARSRLETSIDRVQERRIIKKRENHNLERRKRQIERFSRIPQQEQRSTERRNRYSLERSRASNTNKKVWANSLRPNTRQASSDISRNWNRQAFKDISREEKMIIENGRQSRLKNRVDERTSQLNERKTNYFLPISKLPSIQQTSNLEKTDFIRHTFILALCTIYTVSFLQGKSGFIRNIFNRTNQFSVW